MLMQFNYSISDIEYLHGFTESSITIRISNSEYSFDVNGGKYYQCHLKNGKLHGLLTRYHANGKIRDESNFYNDEHHGHVRDYNEDGSTKSECDYFYGKLHGLYTRYIKGVIISDYNYINGKLHGRQKNFYSDGSLAFVDYFRNGEKYFSEYFN